MFGLFGNKNELPVNEDMRQWIDEAFLWLIQSFGIQKIKEKKFWFPIIPIFP